MLKQQQQKSTKECSMFACKLPVWSSGSLKSMLEVTLTFKAVKRLVSGDVSALYKAESQPRLALQPTSVTVWSPGDLQCVHSWLIVASVCPHLEVDLVFLSVIYKTPCFHHFSLWPPKSSWSMMNLMAPQNYVGEAGVTGNKSVWGA